MKKQPQKWTKEKVRDQLQTNDDWLIRGLMAIYKCQTEDEKQSGVTSYENGIGFNGVDSQFLTQIAVSYKHYGRLTPGQIAAIRPKMLKYAGQLATIANSNEKSKHE